MPICLSRHAPIPLPNGGLARRAIAAMCVLLFAAAFAGSVRAGGGPENVLLVVNSNSLDSKTIANEYIALRNIPASNVLYLDWRGNGELIKAPQFVDEILRPIIEAIGERKLASQIDYVVYSCDFPWRIDLQPLFPEEKFSMLFRPAASITGATYLWQMVRDKNKALMLPSVNWYVPEDGGNNEQLCQQIVNVPSRGFRSGHLWAPDGSVTKERDEGQTYLLSTMLGVTTGRGNTLKEIVTYLRLAAKADYSRPRGTFYYMQNKDVRSQTRHACFPAAAAQLTRIGISAKVEQGTVPKNRPDVVGVMSGIAKCNLNVSGSKLLPGAIVDNLTSFGGYLRTNTGQTPLTDFLRLGAAGASGTVVEPLAIQAKFPLPTLFLHYARGCSLAESYYQSVASPYQLLIVGDPLCQPWAIPPVVTLDSIEPNQVVKGPIVIEPKTTSLPMRGVSVIELFVDGSLRARLPPGKPLQMDTAKLIDGHHELRFVAVDSGPIETRGRLVLPIVVDNHGAKLELSASPASDISPETKVRISASQSGATAIVVRHNDREVGRIEGESGEVEVLAATFGRGPIKLQATSEGPTPARSAPVSFVVR